MKWTEKDIDDLRKLYTTAPRSAVLERFKERPWGSLRRVAAKHGLHRPSVAPEPVKEAPPAAKPAPIPLTQQVVHDRRVLSMQSEIALLREKNKALMQDANLHERILEFNRLAVHAMPAVEPPAPLVLPSNATRESAVLVCSCWHIGEVINKQEMGGLNEYNFPIFTRRLQTLTERAIEFCTQNMREHVFDELHIIHTGDAVSGIIHDELSQTNDLNIVEQAYLGALVTAQAIQDLARVFPKVVFTGVVGNHGRVQHQKYYKHKAPVNWDYIFYNTLALLLQNQTNVTFNIPMSYWAGLSVRGWNFLIQHGDGIKSWAGIPFYGIQREVAKWREVKASQNDHFQYFIASHYHTKAILQTSVGENILNASLKGGDEYAIGLALFNRPSQLLFGVHQRHGKTWELSIDPSRGQDDIVPRYVYDRGLPLAAQANIIREAA